MLLNLSPMIRSLCVKLMPLETNCHGNARRNERFPSTKRLACASKSKEVPTLTLRSFVDVIQAHKVFLAGLRSLSLCLQAGEAIS